MLLRRPSIERVGGRISRVRFTLMNTKNESTGVTPFQLRMGKSSRMIPPLIPNDSEPVQITKAQDIIQHLNLDLKEAHDALIFAKVKQAHYTDRHVVPKRFTMSATSSCLHITP